MLPYGWVKLRLITELGQYHLEQVESAITFNSSGIIIGTHIAVPEPPTLFLTLVALALLGGCRVARR